MSEPLVLSDDLQAVMANEIQRLVTLEQVVRWGLAQSPQLDILEVVIQDEFTHDVIMNWQPGYFLVFDTG